MSEIGITATFSPLDALESISKIYSVHQLNRTEMVRIQSQAESFAIWIREQKEENEEVRSEMLRKAAIYQNALEGMINMILENPGMVAIYKDMFGKLLEANNQLIIEMSKIRITSK